MKAPGRKTRLLAITGALATTLSLVSQAQTRTVTRIGDRASGAPLPSDLQSVAAETIPPSVGGYFTVKSWPSPPLPIGLLLNRAAAAQGNWTQAFQTPCGWMLRSPDVQVYFSPSLNALVLDDSALASDNTQSANRAEPQTNGGETPPCSYGPDDLWLEAISVTNDSSTATANILIHAPQPGVYDLFYAPTLPSTPNGWYWISRALPGETNLFLPYLPLDSGFFILGTTNGGTDPATGLTAACMGLVGASALTNDLNRNGIPDIWEVLNLGHLYPASTDYDSDGVTIDQECAQKIDPNKIRFSLPISSQFVTSSPVPLPTRISAGQPASMAVLVDSADFAGAAWTTFNSNLAVNLGPQGWHEVWVGLRGRLATSQQTWRRVRLDLDTTPPLLIVTNPLTSTVLHPVIQIQGYSSEPLTNLTFDLTDATGAVTHGNGLIVDQYFDPTIPDLTTNWFECLDLQLAWGTNSVTLHAADRAGNQSQANLTYVLTTNSAAAPVITIISPQNGSTLTGTNFTLCGLLDDPTAGVWAQITAANGTSNSAVGLVERTGRFWVENLPVFQGSNFLALRATNAAGMLSTTNLTLVKALWTSLLARLQRTSYTGSRHLLPGL